LVPDPQDPLSVGSDDHVDLGVRAVPQELDDRVPKRVRDEEAARATVDVAELCAARRHHRGVHDGGHLLEVVDQESIEQDLVVVLEGPQVDVPLEVVRLALVGLVGSDHLLVERLDLRGQQGVESEGRPLLVRERGPFVEERGVQEVHPFQTGEFR